MNGEDMKRLCDQYIREKENECREHRLRPRYHFSSPAGWMNDPHPPIWFAGEYQLYFNLYPFQPEGVRPKCWGHASTGDFTSFRLLPCVLAPDQDYDRDGCASGCVAERDGILYAYYTGRNYYRLPREVQCMAVSRDGNHFVKPRKNPILTPDSPDRNDYRDPAVFRLRERHIMLLGVKEEDGPALLAYSSGDMYSWTFESVFLSGIKELGSMWECPSLRRIGAADYLILSPEKIDGVDQRCICLKGTLDPETVTYSYQERLELDYGADFYAAQFYDTPEGEVRLIAWMSRWKNQHPTIKEGWIGSLTLPRKVREENGRLCFSIPEEFRTLRGEEEVWDHITAEQNRNLFQGRKENCAWISMVLERSALKEGILTAVFFGDEQGTAGLCLTIDRMRLTIANETVSHPERYREIDVWKYGERTKLDILLDISCAEICINDSEFITHCVTHCVSPEGDGIWLKAAGTDIVLERLEIAKMGKTPVEYQL